MNTPRNILLICYILAEMLLLKASAGESKRSPGIFPDCSERKISLKELIDIEKSSGIRSMVDFLNAVPKDSLQTFTFVTTSQSLQHHKVDHRWPRVLRASADAKLVLSFVCNPQSQDYNKVEILHYLEPPEAKFQTISIDFSGRETEFRGLKAGQFSAFAHSGKNSRVKYNQIACAKCHSTGGLEKYDIRPVFPQYPVWSGFYGSDDDVLHPGSKEHENFAAFLKEARNDPCFQTLPWPKNPVQGYELYPYHKGYDLTKTDKNKATRQEETVQIKSKNYHLRPNLKFTDALTHLMAERLAWKFIRNPEYQKVAPLLMMEAAGCSADLFSDHLKKALNQVNWIEAEYLHTFMTPLSKMSQASHLYSLGLYLGINPVDWQLHLNQSDTVYYNTGAAGEYRRDISIGQMTQGVLMKNLSETFPELNQHYRLSRGVSKFFKPQNFSCIDDVAGSVVIENIRQKDGLCKNLWSIYNSKNHRKNLRSRNLTDKYGGRKDTEPENRNFSLSAKELAEEMKNKFNPDEFSEYSIQRGHSIVNTICKNCHGSAPVLTEYYRFLESAESLDKHLNKSSFLWDIVSYVDNERMPKGIPLSQKDRTAVQVYLLNRVLTGNSEKISAR